MMTHPHNRLERLRLKKKYEETQEDRSSHVKNRQAVKEQEISDEKSIDLSEPEDGRGYN